MKKILLFLSILYTFASCMQETNEVDSKGNPYEILLVASPEIQATVAWDTLRHILSQEVEMINQSEPIFDLVTTAPSNFTNVLKKHRNVIMLNSGQEYDSCSVKVSYDEFAREQMVAYVSAPNDSILGEYIWENRDNLIKLFNKQEQIRMVKRITKYNSPAINDTINSMFGISMQIPTGYTIRNKEDNFLWISYETPKTSQGIFIYTYFYDENVKFTQKYSIEMRDMFASLIPGPSDSSYMKTSEIFPPLIKKVMINGSEWVEQRGFWDVYNDFMGGPFVSYSALDKKNNRIIVIDEYLFSPFTSKTQRNLVRQLENIVYSVKLDNE